MDWTNPSYSRLPDPLFEIGIYDFSVPVIAFPEEYLSKRLRGRRIKLYILLGFAAQPGNIKRIPAEYMLRQALQSGLIKEGGTLVEPTSGNMGASLAFAAKPHNIKVVTIVSDSLGEGKLRPLSRHGATVLKESVAAGRDLGLPVVPNSIQIAELYAKKFGCVFLNQYHNPWNPQSYADLVAPKLYEMLAGRVDMLVASIGSSGTLLGLGGYLKSMNPRLKIVATMPYLGQSIDGTRDLERLRQVTLNWRSLNPLVEQIDEITAKAVSAELNVQGIPAGPSSGAAFKTAEHVLLSMLADETIDTLRGEDGNISVVIPFADTLYPYAA